jgi:hypothetical protein
MYNMCYIRGMGLVLVWVWLSHHELEDLGHIGHENSLCRYFGE